MSKQSEYWAKFVERLRNDDAYFSEYATRFWARCKQQTNGCWTWQGYVGQNGYGYVTVFRKAGPFTTQRIAFALSHRNFEWSGEHICHHCDNPPCCRPDHLFAGTMKDNIEDCIKKGRFKFIKPVRGEAVSTAKLSDADVTFIIEHFKPKTYVGEWTRATLAARFNVSPATIYRIAMGKSWRHRGGTTNKGNSFLSADQKAIIDKLHTPGMRRGPGTRHELAKTLGVPEHAISNYVHRRNKTHIK